MGGFFTQKIPDEILQILISRAVYARDNIQFVDENLKRKRFFAAQNGSRKKRPFYTGKKQFNQLYKRGVTLKGNAPCKKCGNVYFTVLSKNIYKVGEIDIDCDCKICHAMNTIVIKI